MPLTFIQKCGGLLRKDEASHWLRSVLYVSVNALTLMVG